MLFMKPTRDIPNCPGIQAPVSRRNRMQKGSRPRDTAQKKELLPSSLSRKGYREISLYVTTSCLHVTRALTGSGKQIRWLVKTSLYQSIRTRSLQAGTACMFRLYEHTNVYTYVCVRAYATRQVNDIL